MPTKTLFLLCVLCLGLFAGCSKSPTTNNNNSRTASGNPSATTPNPSPVNKEKIGIADCDDFIAKYETCISSKVPDAQKTQFQENINALRNSWRQLASNPGAKDTLSLMCKRQVVQARESMKDFNCEF